MAYGLWLYMAGNQCVLDLYILIFNKILVFAGVNNGDSICKEKEISLFLPCFLRRYACCGRCQAMATDKRSGGRYI